MIGLDKIAGAQTRLLYALLYLATAAAPSARAQPCESLTADFVADGIVNYNELSFILYNWNSDLAPQGDLDRDGKIGLGDFFILADQYGKSCDRAPVPEHLLACVTARKSASALVANRLIYEPGLVLVGFVEGFTHSEGEALIEEYGLQRLNWHPAGFTVATVEVAAGDRSSLKERLLAHESIGAVEEVPNAENQLLLRFYLPGPQPALTLEQVENLLALFPNTALVRDRYYDQFSQLSSAAFAVEPGSEFAWLCRLAADARVSFAELSHIIILPPI